MQKKTGKGINEEPRDIILHTRISKSEMNLLLSICEKRKKFGKKRYSRTDVIVDALQFSDGQIVFLK